MTAIVQAIRRNSAAGVQYFFWSHPEWWTVVLCAVAWLALLAHAWPITGHELHRQMPFAKELWHWLLMSAAMMLPFTLDRVRLTAEGSFWERRHVAIAGFLVGYFAPWLAAGGIAASLRQVDAAHTYTAVAVTCLGAALWQRTRIYQRAVINCHRRRPLAPEGWAANRDCFLFGAMIGWACVVSCWPLMLACAFAAHGIIPLAGGLLVTAIVRRSRQPRPRLIFGLSIALSAFYAAQAI